MYAGLACGPDGFSGSGTIFKLDAGIPTITGFSPSATSGTAFYMTLTARNQFENVVKGFRRLDAPLSA